MGKFLGILTFISFFFLSTNAQINDSPSKYEIHLNVFQQNIHVHPYYALKVNRIPAGIGFKLKLNQFHFGINANYLNTTIESWNKSIDNSSVVYGSRGAKIYGVGFRLSSEYHYELNKFYGLFAGLDFNYDIYQIDDIYFTNVLSANDDISYLFLEAIDLYASLKLGHRLVAPSGIGLTLASAINFHNATYDQTLLREFTSGTTKVSYTPGLNEKYYTLTPVFYATIFKQF